MFIHMLNTTNSYARTCRETNMVHYYNTTQPMEMTAKCLCSLKNPARNMRHIASVIMLVRTSQSTKRILTIELCGELNRNPEHAEPTSTI